MQQKVKGRLDPEAAAALRVQSDALQALEEVAALIEDNEPLRLFGFEIGMNTILLVRTYTVGLIVSACFRLITS